MFLATKPPLRNSQQTTWGSFTPQMESLSFIDQVFLGISFLAAAILAFPHPALAQSLETQTPLVFTIENPTYLTLKVASLPLAEEIPAELRAFKNHPEDVRAPILRDYLLSKRSPVAGEAETILKYKNYRYILAISFAESNFCRHQIRAYNCWGIGGSRPEAYADYDQAFARADQLIQKYHDQGMTTAKLMRNLWVGWQNDRWTAAVGQVLGELQALGL